MVAAAAALQVIQSAGQEVQAQLQVCFAAIVQFLRILSVYAKGQHVMSLHIAAVLINM